MKLPFVTKEQVEEIAKTYPTPFYLYDEKAIRENARELYEAFSWNKGFKEFFAVKATPNPYLIQILKEEGCGVDCSSYTELLMAEAVGLGAGEIMFSSNETPAGEFTKAKELGAYINLDDITHIPFLQNECGVPETVCMRFNPGGIYELENGIMDNPGAAKYGCTPEQMFEAYRQLMALGVKHFGIHSFLVSNTTAEDYYPTLARTLFTLAVELKERTGAHISFINLSGGIGIPYRPEQEKVDIKNQAESTVYQTEKTLNDIGDKLPAEETAPVKDALEKLKAAISADNYDSMKAETENVTQAFYKVSEKLYSQANPNGGQPNPQDFTGYGTEFNGNQGPDMGGNAGSDGFKSAGGDF